MPLKLSLHGAGRTVTGSCLEFASAGQRLLVDCGMFQGSRSLEALNRKGSLAEPGRVSAVILTHAHIDHSGLLPKLVKDGFSGPIWCTAPTADLLEFMLADSGRIQEGDARRHARRRDRSHREEQEPIYTEDDAMAAVAMVRRVEIGQWFEPAPGFRAQLWNAGHILGSASVELEADGVRVLCSGDLGPKNKAFHADPAGASGFDHVICESTYGDRTRVQMTIPERRAMLAEVINRALAKGGNLVIPAFALERTQELLLDIALLSRDGAIGNATAFVDSPLATRATGVFAAHLDELEDTGGIDIFRAGAIHYTESVAESMRLNTISGAIILSASGMCEAGRIRHHLYYNLARRDSTVLFVGFQAEGSLGRVILDGAQRVRISGRDVIVRAAIERIESYSAHADQTELLEWIAARGPIAGSLLLDHGESGAVDTLAALARGRALAPSVIVPEIGEMWELGPAVPARRLRTGPEHFAHAVGRDWQNAYADLATGLKHRLEEIRDDAAREAAIADMRRVLDSYNAFREHKRKES